MFEYIYFKVFCFYTLLLLILTATETECVRPREFGNPAIDFHDFQRHIVVQPIVHHGRTKREIKSTRDTTGNHFEQIIVTMNVDDEDFVLDLLLNKDLISRDHVISYQKNGETVLHKPTKEELDICQYSGTVRGKPDSWVAVSTCRGISGVIHNGNSTKYIEPAGDKELNAQHFVYEYRDLNTTYHVDNSGGVSNTGLDLPLLKNHHSGQTWQWTRPSRNKREAFVANKQSRYLELLLVADNREFQASGESDEAVHRQFKDIANIINSIYAPLNIFIKLVGVVIWSERDAIRLEENGDVTLKNFMDYRRTRLLPFVNHDHAHLVTHQTFIKAVGGLSYLGKICTDEYSGSITKRHAVVSSLVAAAIAHEIGHSLGMDDDTEDCHCPDTNCIMYGYASTITARRWSSCSIASLALSFKEGNGYCLRNVPGATCGNGIVETGEQCDCGRSELTGDKMCTACCHPVRCTQRRDVICFLHVMYTNHVSRLTKVN